MPTDQPTDAGKDRELLLRWVELMKAHPGWREANNDVEQLMAETAIRAREEPSR